MCMAWTFLVVSAVDLDYGAATALSAASTEQRSGAFDLRLPMDHTLARVGLQRVAACQGEPERSKMRPARSPWPY